MPPQEAVDTVERRRELYERMLDGDNLKEVAEDLSEKYGVKYETVREDWWRRDEWLGKIYRFEGEDKAFQDIVSEKVELKERLREQMNKMEKKAGEEPVSQMSNYIGLTRQIENINQKILEALQSHGNVREEPEKHEVAGDVEIKIGSAPENDED